MIQMRYKNYKDLHKYFNILYVYSHIHLIYGYTGSHRGQIRSKRIDYPTIYHGGFNDKTRGIQT